MRPVFIGLIIAIALWGCVPTSQSLRQVPPSSVDLYRERAKNLEKEGDLYQALLTWQVVDQLEKNNPETSKSIKNLKSTIKQKARTYFQKGLKHYKSGEYGKAQKAFIIAIRYQPNHAKARHYLKTRLQNPEQTTYRVQSGDSFTRIAAKIYDDPGKAYAIAYFNDLDPRKPLMIGKTLLLPNIAPEFLKRRSKISVWLTQARKAYESKQYDEVLSLARKVQDEAPENPTARRLTDAALFDRGMDLLDQGRYLAAVAQFKQVSPDFAGRNQAIAKARSHIQRLAVEEKLTLAQRHLKNKAWESTINTTEEILDQDPDNDQAQMLFSNASYNLAKILLDRGDVAKAVELLGRIDPSYEDTRQMLSMARARMKSQAETHYRDGVKHFIDEDLESAIKDWQQALKLNPEHPKARQDIENAERLLKKLNALE